MNYERVKILSGLGRSLTSYASARIRLDASSNASIRTGSRRSSTAATPGHGALAQVMIASPRLQEPAPHRE